jgi:hypothetical protein
MIVNPLIARWMKTGRCAEAVTRLTSEAYVHGPSTTSIGSGETLYETSSDLIYATYAFQSHTSTAESFVRRVVFMPCACTEQKRHAPVLPDNINAGQCAHLCFVSHLATTSHHRHIYLHQAYIDISTFATTTHRIELASPSLRMIY